MKRHFWAFLFFACFINSLQGAITGGVLYNVSTFTNGNSFPQLAVNPKGQALIVWIKNFTNQIAASFFNGTSWSTEVIIGSGGGPDVGIDQNGNGIAIWTLPTNQIAVARFSSTTLTWTTPLQLTNQGFNSSPKIAVNIFGNAGALWFSQTLLVNQGSVVQGTTFNAATGSWSVVASVFPNSLFSAQFIDALSLNGVQMQADQKGFVITTWQNLRFNIIQAFRFPIP